MALKPRLPCMFHLWKSAGSRVRAGFFKTRARVCAGFRKKIQKARVRGFLSKMAKKRGFAGFFLLKMPKCLGLLVFSQNLELPIIFCMNWGYPSGFTIENVWVRVFARIFRAGLVPKNARVRGFARVFSEEKSQKARVCGFFCAGFFRAGLVLKMRGFAGLRGFF